MMSYSWQTIGGISAAIALVFSIIGAIFNYAMAVKALEVHVGNLVNAVDRLDLQVMNLERQITGLASGSISLSPVESADCGGTEDGPDSTYLVSPTPTHVRAVWGIGQDLADVTAQIDALCDGRYPCRTEISAADFGPDRWPGAPKDLHITFDCNGEPASILGRIVDTGVLSIRCQ